MELKPEAEHKDLKDKYLLIVPYGIETVSITADHAFGILLIVPYGIETFLIE